MAFYFSFISYIVCKTFYVFLVFGFLKSDDTKWIFCVFLCVSHLALFAFFGKFVVARYFFGHFGFFRLCRVFVCRTIFNQFLQSSQPEIRNEKRAPKKRRELAGSSVYFLYFLAGTAIFQCFCVGSCVYFYVDAGSFGHFSD